MAEKKLSTHLTEDDIKFLYNEMRKASIIWSGRKEILRLCRRKVLVGRAKNGNPKYKLQWQCAECKKWKKREDEMEVDHIVEIGGVTSFNGDWNEMIARIFPRPVEKHLQALCGPCHLKKTLKFTSARTLWKRKPRAS